MQPAIVWASLLLSSTLAMSACTQSKSNEMKTSPAHECYETSVRLGEALGISGFTNIDNLSQLRQYLDGRGIEYTLNAPDPALSLPTPSCLDCQTSHFDRIMYLILERSRQTRVLERYRIYLNGTELICVEEDFAYKNPYQD